MLGIEALHLQGFPRDVLARASKKRYSDAQLCDLAGNSFTGSVAAAYILAALVYAPTDTDEECEDQTSGGAGSSSSVVSAAGGDDSVSAVNGVLEILGLI